MAGKGPTNAKLWVYDVGFGDCLLLELAYPHQTRFVLFDFGTKGLPPGAGPRHMQAVADAIEGKLAEGELVAVVATHRHRDHIASFPLLPKLAPRVVVQPWTDKPSARRDWTGPGPGPGVRLRRLHDPLGFMPGTLAAAQSASEHAFGLLGDDHPMAAAAKNNQENPRARAFLEKLCPASRHDYVFAGGRAKNLERCLPGVKISVLGPPTVKQYASTLRPPKRSSADDDEHWLWLAGLTDEWAFWHRAERALASAAEAHQGRGRPLFPRAPSRRAIPPEGRWLVERMSRERRDAASALVQVVDSALNNTSVILLLTIGKTRLLFSGDAEVEAWKWALCDAPDHRQTRAAVGATDLYKVGHHGSWNATPRGTLWPAFGKKGGPGRRGRMVSVLSTKPGTHPSVPAPALLRELKQSTTLYSTRARRPKGQLCIEVPIRLRK